jgi:hypothetical protein
MKWQPIETYDKTTPKWAIVAYRGGFTTQAIYDSVRKCWTFGALGQLHKRRMAGERVDLARDPWKWMPWPDTAGEVEQCSKKKVELREKPTFYLVISQSHDVQCGKQRYKCRQSAENAAVCLAAAHKGHRYYVLMAVSEHVAEGVVSRAMV